MKSIWFKGYSKDKESRKEQVQGAAWAFKLLEEVLLEHYRKRENVRDYSDPQWVHKQIAVNEYNQALDDILDLIKIEKG